jgi:hypothetical protein
MSLRLSIVPKKPEEAPVAYPGAPLDSERAKQPPLPEPPYKPYREKPVTPEAAYEPYAKKPALPEVPYEPYKDM